MSAGGEPASLFNNNSNNNSRHYNVVTVWVRVEGYSHGLLAALILHYSYPLTSAPEFSRLIFLIPSLGSSLFLRSFALCRLCAISCMLTIHLLQGKSLRSLFYGTQEVEKSVKKNNGAGNGVFARKRKGQCRKRFLRRGSKP